MRRSATLAADTLGTAKENRNACRAAPVRFLRKPRAGGAGASSERWGARLLLAALLVCVGWFGCSCRSTACRVVTDPAPAAARLLAGGSIDAEVAHLAQPLVDAGALHGVFVGVVTPDGRTRAYSFGRAGHAKDAPPPDEHTLFQIGSISKVFLANLLASLVADGTLRYDANVREMLPPEVAVTEDLGRVTLHELVTHSGGLPRERLSFTELGCFLTYMLTARNIYGYINEPYLRHFLRVAHPAPPAKRGVLYSNIGVGLLAYLIENGTGRSIPDLMAERISGPLGLHDTVFRLDPAHRQRLAAGHIGAQGCWKFSWTYMPDWDMGRVMGPSGGMYSTGADLLAFAKVNLGLTPHPLRPVLLTTHAAQVQLPEEDIALGWIVNHFDDGRRTIVFKHGMVSGYYSYLGLDVQRQVGVVVLANSFSWDDRIGHNLVLRLSRWAEASTAKP